MKTKIKNILHIGIAMLAVILSFSLVSGSFTSALAANKAEAQAVVDKAKGTFTDLMNDKNFSWMHQFIEQAKGIVIFPQVIKGGFIVGGSGGTGVFLVRDSETGMWSEPAFYTLGSVTLGLQIGGQAAEVVMLAMSQKAIDSLTSSSFKLGGDASVAVGPFGAGAEGSATIPEVKADFIAFTKAKGLYAGLNLEGSVVAVRDSLNESYYGKTVEPTDIIYGNKVANPGADELRSELGQVSAKHLTSR